MFTYSTQAVCSIKQEGPVMFPLLVLFLMLGYSVSFAQLTTDTVAKPKSQRPGARAEVPALLPGKGLAQHDFLYAGGWDTRKDTQTVFRVVGGKVVWTWSIPIKDRNGQLSEFSDIHQLSNGNVLRSEERRVGKESVSGWVS